MIQFLYNYEDNLTLFFPKRTIADQPSANLELAAII